MIHFVSEDVLASMNRNLNFGNRRKSGIEKTDIMSKYYKKKLHK